VDLVAENFGEARFLEFGPDGTLFVAQPGKGTIKVLRPKDGKYAVVADFVKGYKSVHGLHYADGWLWFTTSGAVYRARDKHGDGIADEIVPVLEGLPNGGHWWRSIFVVNDGFFTSIGDSGNISEQNDTDRQKIWKYSLDGKTRKLWSTGIRNTEKLRYRPGTTELYGADHGSDWFGGPLGDKQGNQPITDYNPPCEFNLYTEGAFYGHPYITGNRVPRVEFQTRPDIIELAAKTTVPAWNFGAHWAPNGFSFITRGALKGDALVAMHGSWNSSRPVGYRIEHVHFDTVTGAPYGAQMLVGTVGKDNKILGRPVDVAQASDGTILFSDDQTSRIYRIVKLGE
jgi:glucose/arabinose dehydrogenase